MDRTVLARAGRLERGRSFGAQMTRDGWLGVDHRFGGAGDRLEEVCRTCVLEAGVDGAGLTLASTDGTPETVFATDTVAAQVEDLQFTLGEGPCVEAVRTGEAVVAPHLGVTDLARWPAFGREAAAIGVAAVFALPVRFGADCVGALGLHRLTPGPLDRRQLASAVGATDAAATLLADGTTDGLTRVVPLTTYRMVVHQAAGMAMVQLGTSLPEALVRLRAAAFAEGISINDLATDLVSRRRRLAREEA